MSSGIFGAEYAVRPLSPPRFVTAIPSKPSQVAWVVVAYAVASYTRLFRTAFADDRVVRPAFRVAVALFSVNVVLTLYLTAYLPFRFPVTPSHKTPASSPEFWAAYCPRVVPVMTACGVAGSFLLVRACYPVWGFLTRELRAPFDLFRNARAPFRRFP